jgi:hypothetical protein
MRNLLNEEIDRMKKLMSFSLGETSDNLVVEQRNGGAKGWRLGLKFWPGAKGIGSGGFTFSTSKGHQRHLGFQIGKEGSQIVDEKGYKGKIETDPIDEELTGWKEFLATDGNMVKRMAETSKSNWETLKNDPEHIGYAVYSLEEFNRTFPEFKWQYVFCNTEDGIKQELKNIPRPPEEDKVPGDFNAVSLPIEFPVNGPSNTFFKDNEWAPTEDFAARLEQEVLGPLREIKNGLKVPEGEPVFFLEELEIITSCSRFRNTGAAKDLTFKQLAENRNNSAKEFILGKLKELGVVVDGDTSITQNSDGENGDGSSGPNTPKGLFVATDGKELTALAPKTPNAEDIRSEYGNPLTEKTAYDDYKYCIAGMSILANTKYEKPDPEEGGDEDTEPKMDVITIDVPTKEFNVSFYSKPKYIGISFRIPKIIAYWHKRKKRHRKWKLFKKKRDFRSMECPKW